MPDLIAVGQQRTQQWRHPVPEGEWVRLGRAPKDTSGWAVPWDYLISREHADLRWGDGRLEVRVLDAAKNPIYFHERPTTEFSLQVGEEFRIGSTRFKLHGEDSRGDSREESSVEERSYGLGELKAEDFGNSASRLEVLAKLPSLISKSRSDEEFAKHLVELLLLATPRADAAAVVGFDDDSNTSDREPDLLRWKARGDELTEFRPSRGLMRATLERQQSVVHVWNDAAEPGTGGGQMYTSSADLEWAFATPIVGKSGRSWCLYCSGKFGNGRGEPVTDPDDLRGDVRFSQLLGQFCGAIRRVRRLENQQVGLAQFFSPAVMEALTDSQTDIILEPRKSEISVLFCDMRGFSRKAEQSRQELRALLTRVSEALNVMTRSILRFDGVVADFQGDAALGFWGWPVEPQDGALPACRAALAIQGEFQRAQEIAGSPLHDFRVGIGVAHGIAIAGKIGTDDQAKVGAFGPVVTLGSRLEAMTKALRTPILVDEATMNFVKQSLPPEEGRCRRLGRVRPPGMEEALLIAELLPPESPECSVTDEQIVTFEAAVDALLEGRWSRSLRYLDELPATDRVKDFLMIFIALNDYEPPPDWDGVITLPRR
ncbi:MAG: adenylate/guanylate cyclase domain-containing protein [Planctomycetes bacterium]|nr:adenylate/guanylate cyclase domain-containing protein [Planctomycetota bacterium]